MFFLSCLFDTENSAHFSARILSSSSDAKKHIIRRQGGTSATYRIIRTNAHGLSSIAESASLYNRVGRWAHMYGEYARPVDHTQCYENQSSPNP